MAGVLAIAAKTGKPTRKSRFGSYSLRDRLACARDAARARARTTGRPGRPDATHRRERRGAARATRPTLTRKCEPGYVEVPSTLAAAAATVAVADSKKACDNKEHHGMSRYKR